MGNQLLASKIVVQEESASIRQIPNFATAVAGFVGITQWGPVGVATIVQSFEEYKNIFGGYISNSDMTAAVAGFFDNGGQVAWIVRTVHYSDVTTPSTKTSVAASVTLDTSGSLDTLKVDAKYDGTYGNSLKVKISAATNGDSAYFNLDVLDASNLILETWPNLSMLDTDPRYAETIINHPDTGSTRIKVTDMDAAVAAPGDKPVNGTFTLTGGNDGLTSLADTDYVGSSAGPTGLHALTAVEDLTLLMVPGIATSTVHNAMITYCETTRNAQVFAILDPPSGQTASQIRTYVTATAALKNLSECAAIYWPRIKIMNPNKAVFGTADQITVPPSGHIAGVYSRTDNARDGGIYDSPAGVDRGVILGCVGFETNDVLREEVRDLVYPDLINPITTLKGYPRFIDGGRTLKATGNWPQIHQRRGASKMERELKAGLQWMRHSNNDLDGTLRNRGYANVFVYLKRQLDNGAFASKDPEKAFSIDFGPGLNPASKANTVTARIGLAMVIAAEFVVLKFSQDTRAIDAEIAAAKS